MNKEKLMYTGKFRIPTNRFCFKCHHRVFHSDVKDYPYVCPHCDENKYRFETYTKREKNRYVNPIVNAMCIFRKNRALAPHERSAVPLGTDHCPVC